MDADDLDAAIDDAARLMTAGRPREDFVQRVLADVGRDRRFERPWRPALGGLAAAALLIGVFAVFRPHEVVPRREPEAARIAPTRPVQPPATRAASGEHTATARLESAAASPAGASPPPESGLPIAVSAINALAPARLSVPSIAIAAIEPGESLAVDPLQAVAPIGVTRLDLDPEGDRP